MRMRLSLGLAASAAGLLIAPVSAHAVGAGCAPRPDSSSGYEVRAVKADLVESPPTTPPVAILDSGVAKVPELASRLRQGFDATRNRQGSGDTDGHGTAVASVAAAAPGGIRGISPTSPIVPI